MANTEFNKRVWCFFNAHTGTLTGIFETQEAAAIRAKRDGNRLKNGAKVFLSLDEARSKIKTPIKYGVSTPLGSSLEEPIIVCSIYEYDEFTKEGK